MTRFLLAVALVCPLASSAAAQTDVPDPSALQSRIEADTAASAEDKATALALLEQAEVALSAAEA